MKKKWKHKNKSNNSNREVVKIQRAVMGSNNMLIYNKNRSFFKEMPLSSEVRKMLGVDYKGYFSAIINGSGEITIQHRLPEQNW